MDAIAYAKASSAYKLAKLVETGLTGKVNLGGSSIVVPVGTTATRPTLGMGESAIRYNSDLGGLEEWTGVEWKNVSADISAVALKGADTEANILAKVGMVAEDLWIASDTLDGWVYDGSVWINIGPLQGPQGAQGVAGKSAYTVAVEGGFVGTEAQWLLSLVGSTGATGNGIASIVKTGTVGLVDTYTVTMTSGATATFTVTNGLDGVNGIDVDHIAQTSGTGAAGTVDVYTVWGDVAETVNLGTFNVYNGADGTGVVNSVVAGANVTVDNTNPINPVVGLGASVTTQGNTFNGAEQLVKLGVDGKLPVLDGSNLTGIDGLPDQTGFAGKYLKTDGTTATWESASTGTGITNTEFVATAGQTVFTVTYSVGNIEVYRNGLLLAVSDYTATDGTSVVLNVGAAANDIINIKTHDTFDIANTYTKAEIDSKDSLKQDTLVSGTNIKTVNNASILGTGNLAIKSGFNLLNMFTNSFSILESTTWTCPADGDYYIMAIGGGGSGAVKAATNAQATGGGAGGTCLHKATLLSGDILTINIGAGGAYVLSLSSNGNAGGNTTVTGAGLSLVANGGAGGETETGRSVLGGIGGTASGGNIANYSGGRGGNITRTTSFQATYGAGTGGGGVKLGLNDCRGGDITTAFTGAQAYIILTGGGGCNGRGSDVTRTNAMSTEICTNGGNYFNTTIDITDSSVTFSENYEKRKINPFITVSGFAGTGTRTITTGVVPKFFATGLNGFGAALLTSYNSIFSVMSLYTSSYSLGGSLGGIGAYFGSSVAESYNIKGDSQMYLLGSGSGATVNTDNIKCSLSGGNGAVFIMKVGE